MIHVITEQTWSTAKGPIESQPLGPSCLIDSKPSGAELCAMALSAKYHHHDYSAEGDGERNYWWGRDEDVHEFHRFVVRPATLANTTALAYRGVVITSSVTGTRPEKRSSCAAAGERSMIRPLLNGPRSLIRTMTVRPFCKLVTRTIVPKGSERCAAVSLLGKNNSPLAVFPSFCE